MSSRFYSEIPIEGEMVTLGGPEAHHLQHVMRLGPGAEVILFDGCGAEFTARVESCRRSEVDFAVLDREEIERELPFDLTLGVAMPKGDRQRWLIEKSVELGVSRVVPLITRRGVAQPSENALVRLRRAVIEACKQCGRNRLAEVTSPVALNTYLVEVTDESLCLFLHPSADAGKPAQQQTTASAVFTAIGPEGGFDDDEVQSAVDAGWCVFSLGPRVLRTETAAIAITALAARDR